MDDSKGQKTLTEKKDSTPRTSHEGVSRGSTENMDRKTSIVSRLGEIVNASGHRDQLHRQYGLLSICGLALTIDNAWVALSGSIAVSICKLTFSSS
jgi:hypothetical protein